jgi:hypothetical protein
MPSARSAAKLGADRCLRLRTFASELIGRLCSIVFRVGAVENARIA